MRHSVPSAARWAISIRLWSGRRGIGPPIQASAELFQMPLITVAIEALRREAGCPRVRVREDGRQAAGDPG